MSAKFNTYFHSYDFIYLNNKDMCINYDNKY